MPEPFIYFLFPHAHFVVMLHCLVNSSLMRVLYILQHLSIPSRATDVSLGAKEKQQTKELGKGGAEGTSDSGSD